MRLTYKGNRVLLEDDPLDIGYSTPKLLFSVGEDGIYQVGGQTSQVQLIFSLPTVTPSDKELIYEMTPSVETLQKVVITSHPVDPLLKLEGYEYLWDQEGLFGENFGMAIASEPLKGELAKGVFIITTDGSLFYRQIPLDLDDDFEITSVQRKIVMALGCYTGKGCHDV